MSLHRLGWLGVRTERFDEMVALFEDALELVPFQADDASARYRLDDGTTDTPGYGSARWTPSTA